VYHDDFESFLVDNIDSSQYKNRPIAKTANRHGSNEDYGNE
jgi:hypothetical protein